MSCSEYFRCTNLFNPQNNIRTREKDTIIVIFLSSLELYGIPRYIYTDIYIYVYNLDPPLVHKKYCFWV